MLYLSLNITYEATSKEAAQEVLEALKTITEEQVKSKYDGAVTFAFTRPDSNSNLIEFTEIYNKPTPYMEKGNKTVLEAYKKILDSKNLKKQESIAFGAVYQKKFNQEGHLMKTLNPQLVADHKGMALHDCFTLNPDDGKDPVMLKFNFKPKNASNISELTAKVENAFMKQYVPTEITSVIIYEQNAEIVVKVITVNPTCLSSFLANVDFSFLKEVGTGRCFHYQEDKQQVSKHLVNVLEKLNLTSISYGKPEAGFIVNNFMNYQSSSIAPYSHNGSYFGLQIRTIRDEKSEATMFNQVKTWLTKDKIDINKKDYSGRTMLYYACEGSFVSVVKYLLERGAKIENEDYQPLCQACVNYNVEIIKLLLEYGADVNVVDFQKNTPFHWILRVAKDDEVLLEILELFHKHKLNINAQDLYEKDSYLHLATRHGLVWTTRRLINLGADLEIRNAKGNTVLLNCCENSYGWKMDCFRLVQQRGGDIKVKNNEGNSALHIAAKNGLTSIVTFLADKLNINDENQYGNSPIMEAALRNRNVTMIQHLISFKPNLDMKNNANMNVLDLALSNCNLDVCYVLLARMKRQEMMDGISGILPNFANIEKQMVLKKIDLDVIEEEIIK